MTVSSPPLVGREDELAALLDLLDAADDLPKVAVVAGEAGIGKTCRAAVEHGLERGVRLFVGDIEAASDTMETPAYENFPRLGFTMPYRRTHWTVP